MVLPTCRKQPPEMHKWRMAYKTGEHTKFACRRCGLIRDAKKLREEGVDV